MIKLSSDSNLIQGFVAAPVRCILFLIWDHLWPLLHFFWPFLAIFLALWGYFWVGVWFKNIFGTNICRQSTLVLEIHLYVFVFDSTKFCSFFAFFGLFLRLGSGSKTFLRLAYIDNQLWFWKYSHIFHF